MSVGTNAGDAFVEAAKLFEKGGSAKFEGSRAYDNAAKSYKRNDPAGERHEYDKMMVKQQF